ncbi:aldo/keto reductase [Microbulbifer thermotolerans]|uniref:Aldo/keto reductase n=2 Tax=Microbulbifer thermotolerans TaxID=252514 RepID=A0AB35I114_MICTH|nr:aldo/keto reductase [Microbulbifer thermotolerans]MCX2780164.1 aldo/keto reductase [Microbulbifer thermotolerans]MCX2803295.1 aldo/keto reductase [Microbulbifer thermotolerans]MCX2805882.1 aldo/keto reductase [Microbulbifer thermotolerans]MCX2833065.1 aldo/keto reductase [Microbulbifer thermotolerans]
MQRINSSIDQTFSMSRIAMGLWRLADWNYTPQQTVELLERVLELGITTFDLADIYCDYRCEQLFGEALKLKPQLRGEMEIVSKCGIKLMGENNNYALNHYDTSAAHVTAAAESSLSKMGIECLDLLLIHRPDPLMDAEVLAEALDKLITEGKVRAVGVSNFLPHQTQLLQSRLSAPLLVNQIEVSLLHSTPMFDGQLDYCQRERVIPMAWSPFAGGALFTGDSEAARRVQTCLEELSQELGMEAQQLALAWLLRHPANLVPVLGSGKIDRLRMSVAALGMEIPREAWFRLLRAARGRDVD